MKFNPNLTNPVIFLYSLMIIFISITNSLHLPFHYYFLNKGHGYEDLADIYDFYMCHKSEGLPVPSFDKHDLSFIHMGAQFYIDYIYFGHRSLIKLTSQ